MNKVTYIDGRNEDAQLLQYATPFYYYDFDKVGTNLSRLFKYFDSKTTKMFYSIKTNDHPLLLEYLKNKEINAEVASGLELQLARKIGFKKILFNGPAKTREEIESAVIQKDTILIVDSLDELISLREVVSEKTEIGIRVGLLNSKLNKFGLCNEEMDAALELIQKDKNLSIAGLHFHLGSFIRSPEYYKYAFEQLLSTIKHFSQNYLEGIYFIDIGGGIPCEGKIKRTSFEIALAQHALKHTFVDNFLLMKESGYINKINNFKLDNWLSKYSRIVLYYMARLKELIGGNIELYLEPGTAVIGDAVSIFSEVIANKPGKVLIDVSSIIERGHNLFWHPIFNISSPSSAVQREYLFGPLCTSYDLFARGYIGEPLKKGDRVKIASMGAYTFSLHLSFIKSQLAVVTKKQNKIQKSSVTETLQDKYGSFLQ